MNDKFFIKCSLLICVILLAMSLSLFLTTYISQWMFPIFVDKLDLHELVGLSVEDVAFSYREIINFILIPNGKEFSMTYFNSSKEAIQHFSDVKILFFLMAFLGLIAAIFSILLCYQLKIKRHLKSLKTYFNLGLILPIVALSMMILFFDQLFLAFHDIFFQNDYWLFDSAKDPIILVLPQSYFLILGLVWILLYSLTMVVFKYIYTK